MKIKVTEDHIARGVRCNGLVCPIALAIERAWPGCRVLVLPSRIEFAGGGLERTLEVPMTAHSFILAFDRGDKVGPFSFELPIENCDHESR